MEGGPTGEKLQSCCINPHSTKHCKPSWLTAQYRREPMVYSNERVNKMERKHERSIQHSQVIFNLPVQDNFIDVKPCYSTLPPSSTRKRHSWVSRGPCMYSCPPSFGPPHHSLALERESQCIETPASASGSCSVCLTVRWGWFCGGSRRHRWGTGSAAAPGHWLVPAGSGDPRTIAALFVWSCGTCCHCPSTTRHRCCRRVDSHPRLRTGGIAACDRSGAASWSRHRDRNGLWCRVGVRAWRRGRRIVRWGTSSRRCSSDFPGSSSARAPCPRWCSLVCRSRSRSKPRWSSRRSLPSSGRRRRGRLRCWHLLRRFRIARCDQWWRNPSMSGAELRKGELPRSQSMNSL